MGDSDGRPQSVSDDEILRYLRETAEHVSTTAEVADGLHVSRRTALRRLSALADEGSVERKDVGGRSAVWWLPENGAGASSVPADDSFLAVETFASGRSDVSESIDEEVVTAVRSGDDR